MVSFYTLGWPGMIIMVLFLFLYIILCLLVIKRWNICGLETLSTFICNSLHADFFQFSEPARCNIDALCISGHFSFIYLKLKAGG